MIKLPSRQVHLDFHTSELIEHIGLKFDQKQFQKALEAAHLGSITVFAKCHHSWSYYPTKVGRAHPHLDCDLMGQQIEAGHKIAVRVPIYFTVGWSANDAEDHPEWLVRKKDGGITVTTWDPEAKPDDPRPICSWKFLCPSGEYREHMLAQTREIVASYEVDGFFYDITNGPACWCDNCRAGMQAEGIDPDDDEAAQQYNIGKWRSFMAACNEIIHTAFPEATVYYNGTMNVYPPDYTDLLTHFELEDLPTTWGGYDKFPFRAKYYAAKGKDYVAQSGKFHTTWGEFGGFKHPDAIRYECAAMIAFGARCGFGDQLHPCGEADMATYHNIGVGYEYVEQIEEYGLDGKHCANLGLWLSGAPHDQGVVNMLLETQTDFEIALPTGELDKYQTIIIPGGPGLDEDGAAKLNTYLENGGSLLVLGEGVLDKQRHKFMLDLGAKYLGPAYFNEDYLVVGEELAEGVVRSPILSYSAALRCEPSNGEALAWIMEPYFDRTYATYCSHQNTPNQRKLAEHPAALRRGKVIFLAHPLGEIYSKHGARVHRDYFFNALRLIHTTPILQVKMPSAGRANFLHQPQHHRYVAHLLYGPALLRGRCLVIEDLVPLYDIPLAIRVPEMVKKVYLAPQRQDMDFEQADDTVRITVPKVECHQAVVFEY